MITSEQALEIIRDKKYHKFYQKSIDYAMDIAIHADEEPPGELLTARRPKESMAIKNYREKIYIEKTQAPVTKVANSLEKIRKSQDWAIKFPKEGNAKVVEAESLQNYTEENFPKYTSFTNWFFNVCFKQYLIDANAVSFVMPVNIIEKDGFYVGKNESEYLQPYPTIYNSHQVLHYSSDHYLLQSNEKNTYQQNKETVEGNIFYLVDNINVTEFLEIAPQAGKTEVQYEVRTYKHDLGLLPIVKLSGIVKKELKEICLYKSRISPMVPELKEALREYSDLQAEVVQHLHSTLWTKAAQKCNACSGIGQVKGKTAALVQCKQCKGKGTFPFDPYEILEVREPKAGETPITGDPAGFIQKQTEIVKIQNQRVQDHIFYSLSAIGFEFLMSTPLNQSGKAKEIDRAEVNNFTYSVAEDVVRIIDDHYYIFCQYRYRLIVKDEKAREELLPTIDVPQKYDIVSEELIIDEIAKARTSNLNRAITNAVEIEYVHRKFGTDQDMKNFVVACIELDPFASEDDDVLIMKLQNNGITKEDYTIHCNIKSFVKQASEADPKFYTIPFEEQMKVMKKMAGDIITANSAAGKIIKMTAIPASAPAVGAK